MSDLYNTDNQENQEQDAQKEGSSEDQENENQEQGNQEQDKENQDSENQADQGGQEEKPTDDADNQQEENPADKIEKQEKPEKSEGQEEPDEEKAKLFGKPDKYDYTGVLPEGMNLDESAATEFDGIASEYNMSQEGASKIMALAAKHTEQTVKKVLDAQAQALEAKVATYVQSLREDKEIGGAKLNDCLITANLAASKMMDAEMQELFAQSGLNNHPKFVKMFMEQGNLMKEDHILDANNHSSEKQKTTAAAMYGDTTPDKKVK